MDRREELMEEYEDAVFKLLMDQVALAEGEKALEENERLKADPSAAVPEAVERRAMETIAKAFEEKEEEEAAPPEKRRGRRVPLRGVAIAAVLVVVMVSATFAGSPTARAKVTNMFMSTHDTYADFTFTEDVAVPEGYELNVGWVPDDFYLFDQGATLDSSWKIYNDDSGKRIVIEKRNPESFTTDFEDAIERPQKIHEINGRLLEKDDEYRVLWPDSDTGLVCHVCVEGLEAEIAVKIAENLS